MKVKLRYTRVGTTFLYVAGSVVDFPDEIAKKLIDEGAAEPVTESEVKGKAKPEAAMKAPAKHR